MTTSMRAHAITCLLAACGFAGAADQRPSDFQPRPAVFTVGIEVVNEAVGAFTITAGAFGNTLKRTGKGSFEPAIYANCLTPGQDSPNRIYSGSIHHYDSYQSGFLDGAEVRVYRILNGTMTMVRKDSVAEGGTVIEYWNKNSKKIIAAPATSSESNWAAWSRPGGTRWYAVFAVDVSGKESPASNAVMLKQEVPAKGVKPKRGDTNFKPKKGAKPVDGLAAPSNFTASYNDQGIIQCSWDAVDGATGYRLAFSDSDPSKHRGVYLELAGKASSPEAEIRTGDMVIVRKSMAEFTSNWLSNRLGNLDRIFRGFIPDNIPKPLHTQAPDQRTWQLVKHATPSPVPNAGEYYFELSLTEGESQNVGQHGIPDISTTKQEYYPVPTDGAEYIMEVWMKADQAGRAPVTFTYDGDERIGGFVGQHPIEVSEQWQGHEVRFTGKSSDTGHHAYFVLKAQGPGTYSFDNFKIYRADADYLDYLPYQYEQLKASGMSAFRTHGPIKTQQSSYTMRQYLGAAGQAEGVAKGNTLGQALKMLKKAEIDPWLQIEYHMSPDEWLAFIEYMAAPFDPATDSASNKPYAAMRHAQGQTEPWMTVFDTIYFELSNETWNGLFRPWVFDGMTDAANGKSYARGEVYALMHDHVAEVLRSSPYWQPAYEKSFVHMTGGWATTLRPGEMERGYTQEIAKATKHAEYVTIAAYNGGWDEGEGPPRETPASYFNVLSQVNQTAIPRIITFNEVIEKANERLGRELKFGTYEAGPGYALNGLNNAKVSREQAHAQEMVMKSKLAGVATLDSFLARCKYGSDMDNFFTFAAGNLWKSHAKKHRGGQPHASFLPLQIFNRIGLGDMLLVNTDNVSTVDTAKTRRRLAIDNAPLAAVYATRQGQRVTVVCISRLFPNYPDEQHEGFTPFSLKLPFSKASAISLHRLSGQPTDHNIHAEKVSHEQQPIPVSALGKDGSFAITAATGGDDRGMPPAELFIYVFEGTDIAADGRALTLKEVRDLQPHSFMPAE